MSGSRKEVLSNALKAEVGRLSRVPLNFDGGPSDHQATF
jgi:hypothetical protein